MAFVAFAGANSDNGFRSPEPGEAKQSSLAVDAETSKSGIQAAKIDVNFCCQ